MTERKQSERIQTSLLNAAEKKVLVWIANRLPKWVTSDMLTYLGTLGAVIIALGYGLSVKNLNWIWLASFGFIVNWFGDSLDGTLARVRHTQRPIYGFFIDHHMDCINECLMFVGAGLSPLVDMRFALTALCAYLLLSVYVYISAHLKNEFKLTYMKLGPTELRLLIIIVNTLFLTVPALANISKEVNIFGEHIVLHILDYVAITVSFLILVAYIGSLIKDGKYFSKLDPVKKVEE